MSTRSGSSRSETTRPSRLTCEYQVSSPRAVSDTRGSRRMKLSRSRVTSMFTRTRPSSQSYQVATAWGEPSGPSVAMTAGFGRRRNAWTAGVTGGSGIARPRDERAHRCAVELALALAGVDGGRLADQRVELARREPQPPCPRVCLRHDGALSPVGDDPAAIQDGVLGLLLDVVSRPCKVALDRVEVVLRRHVGEGLLRRRPHERDAARSGVGDLGREVHGGTVV